MRNKHVWFIFNAMILQFECDFDRIYHFINLCRLEFLSVRVIHFVSSSCFLMIGLFTCENGIKLILHALCDMTYHHYNESTHCALVTTQNIEICNVLGSTKRFSLFE